MIGTPKQKRPPHIHTFKRSGDERKRSLTLKQQHLKRINERMSNA